MSPKKELITALFKNQPFRGVVSKLARSRAGRSFLTRIHPHHGVYDSLEQAWKQASLHRHAGHDHQQALDRHAEMGVELRSSDYAVLYWLDRIAGDVRLFDYGGNMGNVYYSYLSYIDTSTRKLQWTVYDLPGVIDLAKKMQPQPGMVPPRFTSSVSDAADSNVLLVCGAYHFWEKSTSAFLDQFSKLPEHVFVNRAPFYNDDKRVIAMQSTTKFAFPIVIRGTSELIEGFKSKGYELVDRWTAPEYDHVMPFFPDLSVRSYFGFYFRLKKS